MSPHIIEPASPASRAVIWLHGLGADCYDFVPVVEALQLPENHGIRFIFPQAPTRPVTINGGFPMPSWYDILGVSPARAINQAQLDESIALVRQLIDEQCAQGIALENIVLAGFSQGGAVVLCTAVSSQLPLAGVMALSTYGPDLDQLLQRHPVEHSLSLFHAHGRFDEVLPLTMGREAHDLMQAAGHQTSWHEYAMAHEVCMPEIADIRQWLVERLGL